MDTSFPLRPPRDVRLPGHLKALALLCLVFGAALGWFLGSVPLGLLAAFAALFCLVGSDHPAYHALVVLVFVAGVTVAALTRSAFLGGALPVAALLGCTIAGLVLGVRADRREVLRRGYLQMLIRRD